MDARLEKIGRKLQQDSGIKVDFTDIREKLFELCITKKQIARNDKLYKIIAKGSTK